MPDLEQIAQKWLDAFNKHDLNALMALSPWNSSGVQRAASPEFTLSAAEWVGELEVSLALHKKVRARSGSAEGSQPSAGVVQGCPLDFSPPSRKGRGQGGWFTGP